MSGVTGGDKIIAHLQKLQAKVGDHPTLRLGFLENATYPSGEPVAMVAAIQEFGTKGIPARSFFRTMVKAKSSSWGPATAKLMEANQSDAIKTLGMVGQGIAGQLRQSIVDLVAPPLSAVTLMLRSMRVENPGLVITGATVGEAARRVASGAPMQQVSTKPLVDTGHLLNSVDYEVVP